MDFGPLNLAMLYRYCVFLHDLLEVRECVHVGTHTRARAHTHTHTQMLVYAQHSLRVLHSLCTRAACLFALHTHRMLHSLDVTT
jgi:hypothetical protein